uniref:NADH dehydrogenase subunit 6 n=1 Tax=Xenostrobus securis TaxID=1289581 RepID=UPI00226D08F3|nr:NADH dehydrogenase subunit 6 [Xenostrobus securis]UZG65997.1 NADH dehydrogenase subunit 6 [Xenostrobus securis]
MMLGLLGVLSLLLLGFMSSLNQPLLLAFFLGSLALVISLIIGSQSLTLLGYFVGLIYIGGVMVLFGYVLSIFPNQRFNTGGLPSKLYLTLVVLILGGHWDFSGMSGGALSDFSGYVSSSWVYVLIGGLLLFILLLVVSMCDKGRLPLRCSF